MDVEQPAQYKAEDVAKTCRKWLERIRTAEKREDAWVKQAEQAEKAYLCQDKDAPAFNVLHSNIETIVPAIYNSTGRPDIRPRHNVRDQVAKEGADLLERAILANVDDSRMDIEVEAMAQDAFLAGRGVVRIRFDADVIEQPVTDPMGMPVMGPEGPMVQQIVMGERVLYEAVAWRDYRQGPGARWQDIPWVAYRHIISDDAVDGHSDPDLMAVQVTQDDAQRVPGDVHVWEVWCKETGNVYLIDETRQKLLNITPDPLKLTDFFPQIKPVQPISGTGMTTPVCPYAVYKELAEELDDITRRITDIVAAMKVKGAAVGSSEGLSQFAEADDNTITTIPDSENLAALGGLDKFIAWWPMEPSAKVLASLYQQREQIKATIYEVTGISDIIRGQGAASETATAQQIKTEWGSLRIKKMQKAIERAVRELFVLTAEVMSLHFSPDTLGKLAGVQISPQLMPLLQKPMDHYRIDVESESTIRADLTNSKREMSEFLNATAQYASTMAPIVEQAPGGAVEALEIFTSFASQFNLGKTAEDALASLVEKAREAAQNPQPSPEQQKMQIEAKKAETEAQLEAMKLQVEVQIAQAELEIKRAELALKQQELQLREAEAVVGAANTLVQAETPDQPVQ